MAKDDPEYIPDVVECLYDILAELPDDEASRAIVEVAAARFDADALRGVATQLNRIAAEWLDITRNLGIYLAVAVMRASAVPFRWEFGAPSSCPVET